MAHNLTGRAYDDAQSRALVELRANLDRAALDIEQALSQVGSPDVCHDAMKAAMRALAIAVDVNSAIGRDDVEQYADTTCDRCGRTHQRRYMCVCRG